MAKIDKVNLNWVEREMFMSLENKDKNNMAKVFNTIKTFSPSDQNLVSFFWAEIERLN